MKILLINNHHYNVGGAETVYLNTINVLIENGHEVLTLSRRNNFTHKTKAKEFFIDYSNSFANRFYSVKALKMLKEVLKNNKPDVVHLHSIIGGITFSILPLLKKNNIPVVATIHDFRLLCPAAHFMDKQNEICEKCEGKYFYKAILKKCSKKGLVASIFISLESYLRNAFFRYDKYINTFVFVSNFTKRKFLNYNTLLDNKSAVVLNPGIKSSKEIIRGAYFLFFGRLSSEKGLITLLDAFSTVPGYKLKVVGTGPIEEQCKNLKLSNVEFLGFQSGVVLNEIIKLSSFVIIPSECLENLSMVAVESMLLGKPVIASRIGALEEIIADGVNGYLFEPKSVNDLGVVINKAASISDEEYLTLSNNSYSFGIEKFSSSQYYNSLMSVYNQAVSGNEND